MDDWLPISEAPKDGTAFEVKLKDTASTYVFFKKCKFIQEAVSGDCRLVTADDETEVLREAVKFRMPKGETHDS